MHFPNGSPAQPLSNAEATLYGLADDLASTPQIVYRKVPADAKTGFVVSQTGAVNLISASEFIVLKPPTIRDMQPTTWNLLDPLPPLPPVITLEGDNFVEYPHPNDSPNPSFQYVLNYDGMSDSDSHLVYSTESNSDDTYYGNGLSHQLVLILSPQVRSGPIRIQAEMLNPTTNSYDAIGDLITPTFSVIPDDPPGDADGDGLVTIADVTLLLQDYLGLIQLAPDQTLRCDVRPKPGAEGRTYGDGRIGADDLNWTLRRVIGLESAP